MVITLDECPLRANPAGLDKLELKICPRTIRSHIHGDKKVSLKVDVIGIVSPKVSSSSLYLSLQNF